MKYIVALFCIVAYVSGNAVELQSTQKICACRGLLNKILGIIEQQEGAIKQANLELDAVDQKIDDLDKKVDTQGDKLIDADAQLQVLLLLQKHTLSALDEQNDTFVNILSVLSELSKDVEEVLCDAEDLASTLELLLDVTNHAEECTDGQCKGH